MSYGEAAMGLSRAGIEIPNIAMRNKDVAYLKLNSHQLRTLLSAMETKGVKEDMCVPRRITVAIFA